MRFNFKKIAAIGTSILLTGMSMGFAAAAYPAPFVQGGVANVGVVYGTGAGVDAVFDVAGAATPIMTNLQSYMSGSTGTSATTSGEVVSLDTSADRIWLNTSLNAVKSTFTKSDLPTVLADYSFSGDVTSKVTSTIKMIAGDTTTVASDQNTGTVIFAKQPESSDDPVIGISMGTSQSVNALYNASATMSAVNFTSADSEGEEIQLFGQTFTVASETDTTNLVLLKEAEKINLAVPSNPSQTVTVGGAQYTIRLITASSTSANIEVTNSAGVSASKEVNEADSKRINGLDVAVTTATSSSLESVGESASIIVGSQKVTLTDGSTVTIGEDDDPVDGTYVYLVGGTTATTEIAVAVFRPDSTNDAIIPGQSFVDPVFGSFKLDFAGLSSPLDDAGRGKVSVKTSGDDTLTVSMTDDTGNAKTFDYVHNQSGSMKLGDSSNYSIAVREGANLSYGTAKAKYTVVGNEDYGHLLELYDVYNQTSGTGAITNDRVKFRDVITGENYETSFTSTEGSGTLDVDGKRYTVTFFGTGEDGYVYLKYPTSESASTEYVMYPTIALQSNALASLYEPLTLNLSNMNGLNGMSTKLWFPNGDGYTGITTVYSGIIVTDGNWTIDSTVVNLSASGFKVVTVGQNRYNFTSDGTANRTIVYLVNPESNAVVTRPALNIIEGKDDNTQYHSVVVTTENSAGTSTDGLGVDDILFSSDYYHTAATLASDSDITEDMDWYGTLTTKDASDSDQKNADISYPASQVYAQIYLGEISSTVTGGTGATGASQLGNVLYKDSEVSSASTKNLIIVGGSCINSAAAALVGGAKCDADFTTATGVGSGQFLIQSFGSDKQSLTSGIALLVAGYEGTETVNAATYLTTQRPDVSAGKKWIGTSSTSATLQTVSA